MARILVCIGAAISFHEFLLISISYHYYIMAKVTTAVTPGMLPARIFARTVAPVLAPQELLALQIRSWERFWESDFRELLNEISPITDHSGKELEVAFLEFKREDPLMSEEEARAHNASYEATVRVRVRFTNKKTKEVKEQEVYLCDFPLMTPRGTFIVNGVERVIIPQLIRSPGVFFTRSIQRGRVRYGAKIIPNRGAWLEFETDAVGVVGVKVDRRRRIPATTLLRALGMEEADMKKALSDVDTGETKFLEETLKRDTTTTEEEALLEIYARLRPGDLATVENARTLLETLLFSFGRYDLAKVGRWKMDMRLRGRAPKSNDITTENRVLTKEDLLLIIREVIAMHADSEAKADEIDHLGNRRVRTFGELLEQRLRIGFSRMERIVKDRMSTLDLATVTPIQLVNARPVVAAVREFFSSSQLSQFMDNVNPLAELEHKRRVSAMGPGGLTRERAGFEVRDVQPSHYGRICPIQTPEGPNIGLVGHLAIWARPNEFGFLETPYFRVEKSKVTNKVVYLDAGTEQFHPVANASTATDKNGKILDEFVEARFHDEPRLMPRERIEFMDVAPQQALSVATALIPFLEHDDASRALMGANMQRQAVPCIKPEAPLVGTGMEATAAQESGQSLLAKEAGTVKELSANEIVVSGSKGGTITYPLRTFMKSNQDTTLHQRPIVHVGQRVKAGEVLADGSAVDHGDLALGQNLVVAFLPWRGANYEDAIIISERLLHEDRFTSVHIENFVCDVRDTKLGPEMTTPDIPNVGEDRLKDLDEDGVVRIGAEVGPSDILVGKISPKGEVDLTAEERLLRSIFGEKARDVKDTSLRMPHGKRGRVISVRLFERERGDALPPGVIRSIQVEIASLRPIQVGDKLAGRHGNKGVISRVLPVEDMPYLEDGSPVDIVLSPLGVASRMNIGQILETHLGAVAKKLGIRAKVPALAGIGVPEIKAALKEVKMDESGKQMVYDGQTGEPFPAPITVGVMYIMKLAHMVEDKIHMRSIGPYSLITQQPLGGKAQFGGQRFGEMEVWALEGYGAAHTLQEMLTVKSDDVSGRSAMYESIIRGRPLRTPNVPASFNVLLAELKALGLDVQLERTPREGEESEPLDEAEAAARAAAEASGETDEPQEN